MSSRENILARLSRGSSTQFTDRLFSDVIPAHTLKSEQQLVAAFKEKAKNGGSTVFQIEESSLAELITQRTSQSNDCFVAYAAAGIAETGTVCFNSEKVKTRHLFLFEHLIVVLPAIMILPYQEDFWALQAGAITPRACHLISGPSRTADVEQVIQIGAHGPKRLDILILQ